MSFSHSKRNAHNFQDLTGQRFGRLQVIRQATHSADKRTRWWCQCDCGNICITRGKNMKDGDAQSCGCLRKETTRARSITHGQGAIATRTPEYQSWASMKSRCYNPKTERYPHYGARGITVCERWLNSFENFFADMGQRPGPSYSLDRIDVHGNYTPENCRWATARQQARNTQKAVYLTHAEKTLSVWEWADIVGISSRTLHERLRRGWPPERMLGQSPRTRRTIP